MPVGKPGIFFGFSLFSFTSSAFLSQAVLFSHKQCFSLTSSALNHSATAPQMFFYLESDRLQKTYMTAQVLIFSWLGLFLGYHRCRFV